MITAAEVKRYAKVNCVTYDEAYKSLVSLTLTRPVIFQPRNPDTLLVEIK